ncbi:histidine phosphatase family protein [Pseudanabaenaceae cyanobacterium LEGE 13415]|nr:histidine phosphatase family protein [Pseudanabaenaceae cyanobacterium LEGE 13415]
MVLTLYLMRHGETTYSQTGGFCGSLNPDLTEAGTQMAIAFGKAYSHLDWTAAYVSPMKRTIATAKPLCEAVGLEMQLRDGLREINFGEWEGKTQDYVKENDSENYIHWMTEPAWNAPPGGETAIQIASRSELVITEITQTHKDGNVLVVSHKSTIRIMLCGLLGIDLGRYRDRIDMPAASVSVIEFGKYGPKLKILGDRSYMSAELRSRPGT